ncbi:MAG: hypothetical protein HQM13_11605 [SAR324 cluster bacterium]|nr:hypothetical protein [SAR324 cluster bacterium]
MSTDRYQNEIEGYKEQIRLYKEQNRVLLQFLEEAKASREFLQKQLELHQEREKMSFLREQRDYQRVLNLEKKLELLIPPEPRQMNTVASENFSQEIDDFEPFSSQNDFHKEMEARLEKEHEDFQENEFSDDQDETDDESADDQDSFVPESLSESDFLHRNEHSEEEGNSPAAGISDDLFAGSEKEESGIEANDSFVSESNSESDFSPSIDDTEESAAEDAPFDAPPETLIDEVQPDTSEIEESSTSIKPGEDQAEHSFFEPNEFGDKTAEPEVPIDSPLEAITEEENQEFDGNEESGAGGETGDQINESMGNFHDSAIQENGDDETTSWGDSSATETENETPTEDKVFEEASDNSINEEVSDKENGSEVFFPTETFSSIDSGTSHQSDTNEDEKTFEETSAGSADDEASADENEIDATPPTDSNALIDSGTSHQSDTSEDDRTFEEASAGSADDEASDDENGNDTASPADTDSQKDSGTSSQSDAINEFFDKGLSAAGNNDYAGAIAAFTKVTELLPDAAPSFLNLAIIHFRYGHYNDALKANQKAIERGSVPARRLLPKIEDQLKKNA